ncbi:MAG: ABC transporter ATP-binding protein [Candidatus Binatia bacterium]
MSSCCNVAFSGSDEAIRLEHLSFSYADQKGLALRDVSLRVRRGEMVVIMGATGAGKTTLAKCLNRIVPAFQPGTLCGEIALFGQTLREEGVAELAGIVGLVSQDFEVQLFATNVVQEVVFGMEQLGVAPDEMRLRLPRVLQAVGLQGFEGRDPATLSGGEKQRLALAATLALQPSIMVFDEPTTDLDPLGKLEIFAVLAAMRRQGYTLVVIEHEIAAAEHADRLVIMSRGEIVADDLPRRVLARVDFLRQHGVRAPDLNQLAARLDLSPPPCSLDAAEAAIRSGSGVGRPVKRPEEPFDKLRVSGECPLELGRGSAHAELVEASGGVLEPQGPQAPKPSSPQASRPPTPQFPFLSVEDVTFSYEGGAPALDRVSLTVDAGEFLAIIGQNGSGKTTLAKHLNGLLSPSAGRVLLRGVDVRTLPINTVATDVGYVFQNPDHQIFAATVYDEIAFGPQNLLLPLREVEDRVHAALVAVGLTGLEDEDPFLLGKGQRQRLAVASVLALRPRLLILDEPTTGLDYLEQRRMMDLLAQLHGQGIAIVMITHTPWVVAEYARRGVLMADGRVLLDAPLRMLLAQEGLLEQAHFCAPDITRLGRRFGFTPLSVDEFMERVGTGGLRAWGLESR